MPREGIRGTFLEERVASSFLAKTASCASTKRRNAWDVLKCELSLQNWARKRAGISLCLRPHASRFWAAALDFHQGQIRKAVRQVLQLT